MANVLLYLPRRFFANILNFLEHWYVRSFIHTSRFMLDLFENLDRAFAVRINLKNLFKPLYQDRSPISYVIGFFFRGAKIILALAVYIVILGVTIISYSLWAAIPAFLIYKILFSYE